jgi:hypothetical protein
MNAIGPAGAEEGLDGGIRTRSGELEPKIGAPPSWAPTPAGGPFG